MGSRVNRRDEHDRLQMREGGADPHLILSARTVSRYVPHHSPMPVSTPPPTLASFNDARIVVEGASSIPRPWIVVRGARSRCPHMHSTGDVRVLASSGLPVASREGWMDGIFCECTLFDIVSALTIIQDFLSFSFNRHAGVIHLTPLFAPV